MYTYTFVFVDAEGCSCVHFGIEIPSSTRLCNMLFVVDIIASLKPSGRQHKQPSIADQIFNVVCNRREPTRGISISKIK